MDTATYNQYFKDLTAANKAKINAMSPEDRVKSIKQVYDSQQPAGFSDKVQIRFYICLLVSVFVVWYWAKSQISATPTSTSSCVYWRSDQNLESFSNEEVFKRLCDSNGRSQFSFVDGSHIAANMWIEQNINDPSSFEHVETRARNLTGKGKYMTLKVKFRAKNAFNAMISNEAYIKIDKNTGAVALAEFL